MGTATDDMKVDKCSMLLDHAFNSMYQHYKQSSFLKKNKKLRAAFLFQMTYLFTAAGNNVTTQFVVNNVTKYKTSGGVGDKFKELFKARAAYNDTQFFKEFFYSIWDKKKSTIKLEFGLEGIKA